MAWNAEAFNCDHCPWGRHCDETRPAPFKQWSIKNVIESNVCLLPMITPESRFLLRLHEHYKSGHMARDGGILEQPNFYLEAMEVLTERETLIRSERADRDRRAAEAMSV